MAVYLLAEKMGIPCCPAIQVGPETVFSEFLYDFNHESIVHFRNLFADQQRSDNDVDTILRIRPQYEAPLFQMLVIDFVTHQDDRHLSNFAIKISGENESFYPLYDNGNSLFFLDREDFVKEKCKDPILYANSFGPVGTQWEAIEDLLRANPSLKDSVNLNVSNEEIKEILKKAKFSGYRYDGAKEWISKSLALVQELVLSIDEKHLPLETQMFDSAKIRDEQNNVHKAKQERINVDEPNME